MLKEQAPRLAEAQARVAQALRAEGLCAGQHEPGSDEIAVATQPGAVMAMVREAAELGMLGDDVDVRWAWCSSLGIDVGTYSPWPATSRAAARWMPWRRGWRCTCEVSRASTWPM